MIRLGSYDNCPPGLPQALRLAASRFEDRGISLLDNRGRYSSHRSFADVSDAALTGAGRWRALGIRPGQPVLVCLPTSWAFLDTWFGALLAGALPVALAPPGALGSPTAQVGKALQICQRIGASWLVAPQAFLDEAERGIAQGDFDPSDTRRIDIEDWTKATPDLPAPDDPALHPNAGDTAFLQLTSGSTGLPRAVAISHGAVVHNALAIHRGVASQDGHPTEHIVSWLPLYHDMGLIGCLSNAIVNGTPIDLLSPRSFLARPWIWLEAISRRERVMAPAPNFAYQLCVERVSTERVAALDLRSYHHILSGSEMVRPETVSAFLEHFAAANVDPARFRPCYGLAETTLAVTMDARGQGARTAAPVTDALDLDETQTVALGEPLDDHEISIVPQEGALDPSNALADGRVGRVLIRSPGLMQGYYQDPDATAEVLHEGWLDSGDLGFVRDGELYLTGRSKEILILNGVNVMPHEIEWVAEEASAAGGSERCGAFSVLGEHGEEPILVMETTLKSEDERAELQREVTTAVGRALSIPLADLVLVRRGSIPRTSSGKVQRRALQTQYQQGSLERLDEHRLSPIVEGVGAPRN